MNEIVILPALPEYKFPKALKIVDPGSAELGPSLGVTPARMKELALAMDKLVATYGQSVVRTCDVYNDIAAMCETLEEYAYAITCHVIWHARHGRLLG